MKRLFNEHIKRRVIDLNGTWSFKLDKDKVGENEGWQNGLTDAEMVTVPSCWNNELGLLNYEGMAWYEKKFYTNGGTIRLEFGSVMTKADIWFDGNYVGDHYGAFTQFEFILKDISAGEHTLTVRVDSTITPDSFPQRYTDWFNYGGIARDVEANELNGITILSNKVEYTLSNDLKNATVKSVLELYNANNSECSSPVFVKIGDTVIYNGTVTLNGYETKTVETPEYTLENINLWGIYQPNLYTVVASTDTDDLIDKIGFRKIEVKDVKVLLNNEAIQFLGVNRHEEQCDFGFAFPAKLMKKDIDLILDMGCNTVRGSHYPNSQIFVDMLDAKGIMFWSEIPMWGVGFSEASLLNDDLMEKGFNMHKEMVKYYYNHPSIVLWGLHNEIPTYSPNSYHVSEKWSKYLRANGGNRLITHASCHPMKDNDMDFDDIISINIYHGWYRYGGYEGTWQDWEKMIEQFTERRKEKGWEEKPVLMSEFGAAALAGYHTPFDKVKWSEEYQRDLFEYTIELFHKTPYMVGTYPWQFANIRTSPSMDINRVRYFNNKGIVDEYRNPKLAYYKIKELYHKYANECK